MTRYPSNYINGAPVGAVTMDNVANHRLLKDTVIGSVSAGQYPTDQQLGGDVLSGQTNVFGDLSTALSQLGTETSAMNTAITALTNASDANAKSFAANESAQRIYEVMDLVAQLTFTMKRLSVQWTSWASLGSLGTSRYPSGQHRGY